ncbi:MAG: Nudix family hydrolase [Nevskiaceae bacterium]
MPSTGRKYVHIAAGALKNARGEVLVCQRPAHKIYPGEWEFPGGKVEPGEDALAALRRELHEELGVTVTQARPLIRLRHRYPELAVDLDTWLVDRWQGEPVSREHPATAWVMPDALPGWRLLAADQPIVKALRLPAQCVFTPERVSGLASRLDDLPPNALLRLRLPGAPDDAYAAALRELAPACRARGLAFLTDRAPQQALASGAGGWHATAAALRHLRDRPVPAALWFGASCHSAQEIAHARDIGADYVVLGPVRETSSHRGVPCLGWQEFSRVAADAGLPVYAIGGVGPRDLDAAWRAGAQGVAGISAYWAPTGAAGNP